MMNNLFYSVIFYTLVLWSKVNGYHSSPFDVRIDHYKTEGIEDLIVNTVRPQFSWKLPRMNDTFHRNVQQQGYQLQLHSMSLLKEQQPFHWDTGRVVSMQSIHVSYPTENDLKEETNYRFRMRIWTSVSEEASRWTNWIRFRTPRFNLNQYLKNNLDLIWIGSTQINMNELRKEFSVPNTSPIHSAVAYISGLGYYQLYLNGNNVDPTRKLDPGWTTYEKRTLMASFDLTNNITSGMNALGIKLGNGWYSQEQQGEPSYGPPRVLFTLTITFEDGSKMEVISDQSWMGRQGSILHDGVYQGELYDARNDRPNWAQVGFNDSLSAWIPAESMPSPVNTSSNGQLILQDMLPIRSGSDALHLEINSNQQQRGYLNSNDIPPIKGASLTDGGSGVLKPISMWQPTTGVHSFDIGQNMVGWCRFKFQGARGVAIYIRHAEILAQPQLSTGQYYGGIYTENLRGASSIDTYILRGDPNGEVYEPTFTVHGFRYVSVIGAPNALTVDSVECPVVHSETTLKGHFTSSNAVVNQIQHNVQWGQLGNIMSVPTDCPQRDERRGWMGDAALSVNEALYNFDLIKFYMNFLNLIGDIQLDNGAIPDIVPGGGGYPADPNWGTALPTITWQLYRHYGDVQILANYYDSVHRYVENIRSGYNTTGLVNLAYQFGDWVPPPPQPMTNQHLIASFAFLHDVSVVLNMSQLLNKTSDTQDYSTLYGQLAEEFHRVFFIKESNFYADGMQSAQVLALALPNVVPENVRGAVFDHLINDIIQKGTHVSTGIVSTAQLYPLLSDNGHHDLALELISSVSYPSYGYMFTNAYENATTIWELWNAPSEGPFMNSRNHIMYGSVGAWFYSHLLGIDFSSNLILIRPRMASEKKKHLMTKIDGQLNTLYGLVHVSYTRHEQDTSANSILMRVTIPPNAQARLIFEPLFIGAHCQTISEGNQLVWSIDTISPINRREFQIEKDFTTGLMTVNIGSGFYQFHVQWK